MNDDDLGTRIRTAYLELDRSTAEPPFRDPAIRLSSPTRPGRSLPLAIAAACGVAVLLVGSLLVAGNWIEQTPSSSTNEAIWGSWRVTAVRVGEQPVSGSLQTQRWTFAPVGGCEWATGMPCEEGPHLDGSDGCNRFERTLTADETTGVIQWGAYFFTEAMFCGGDLTSAIGVLMAADEVRFARVENGLTLAADQVEIDLVPWDTPPPPETSPSTPVVSSTIVAGAP